MLEAKEKIMKGSLQDLNLKEVLKLTCANKHELFYTEGIKHPLRVSPARACDICRRSFNVHREAYYNCKFGCNWDACLNCVKN